MDVLSNIVSPINVAGSMQLQETNPDTTFSDDVLNSAERYALYLSTLIDLNSTSENSTEMTYFTDNLREFVINLREEDNLSTEDRSVLDSEAPLQ